MIEEKDLISIIVPIYNVQEFLPQCIDSILKQTYKNIEIILVDDGSPDDCGKICDEYQTKDNRIKVIHKPNGGLSDARNVGIENCVGQYICFVDSDDILHKDYVMCQYQQITSTNSDISICQYSNFIQDHEVNELDSKNVTIEKLNNHELISKLFVKNNINFICACTKMYKSSLFNTLRFDVGRLHEDEFIIYKIFNICERAVVINLPLYFYRGRQGSITKARNFKQKNLDS
ncbi:MAG: glycosyltransferase family 2 protein, partial [Clostridia bacterium]|nr:glycosyltransferase family 2 protein [Clostridia bacterium]